MMTEPAQNERSGEQGADNHLGGDPGPESSDSVTMGAVNETVTKAVTAHTRRFGAQLDDRFSRIESVLEKLAEGKQPGNDGRDADGADIDPRELRLQELQTTVNRLQSERKAEQARNADLAQKQAIRKAAEATGTHKIEQLARYLEGEAIRKAADGSLYVLADDMHLTLEEHAASIYESEALWHPPSGRGGGGGTPRATAASNRSTSGGMSAQDYREKLQELIRSGDDQSVTEFQTKVMDGTIRVAGLTPD